MDQNIYDELLNKYAHITSSIEDIIEVRKAKLELFKEYLLYKEELIHLFLEAGGCYLNFIIHCPGGSCKRCCNERMYTYLLNNINHYPLSEEEEKAIRDRF